MNALVIKILAVGLTMSQIFTRPLGDFRTNFNVNSEKDKQEIQLIMHDGCQFIITQFKAQKIDFDLIFSTMVGNLKANQAKKAAAAGTTTDTGLKSLSDDQQKLTSKTLMEDMDFEAIYAAFRQFCKAETVENSPIKMDEVVAYYNETMKDLPNPEKLKNFKLKESSLILDNKGERFTEVYAEDNRRNWVPISEIPKILRDAVIATEDQHFRDHPGVDVGGIIRAFMYSMGSTGRPQGGSTITQQVVKNLLLNDDLTFERKIREIYLASRLSTILTKDEILELYLNFVFLGRASWGVEMASQTYFGKSVRDINLSEATVLAAMIKGPNVYHPQYHPLEVKQRQLYVLGRMTEDKYISEADATKAKGAIEDLKKADTDEAKANVAMRLLPAIVPFEPPRARAAYYFLEAIQRDVRQKTKIESLTDASFVVKSTIDRQLQMVTERALQDGLEKYELAAVKNRGSNWVAEGSLATKIKERDSTWEVEIARVKPRLFDVQWTLATVVQTSKGLKVGLQDGTVMPLVNVPDSIRNKLKLYDLLYVGFENGKSEMVAKVRIRPKVQGAVVVLEAKTGRVLAMTGGFAFLDGQFDRATRSRRQPGSTLKPFIYLGALQLGFQPNSIIQDLSKGLVGLNDGDRTWQPSNYEGKSKGMVTLRAAVEHSYNKPTAYLVSILGQTPAEGFDYIQGITQELDIYDVPERRYPFILGAQPTRVLDMAVAYATIANLGLKPIPHFFDSIEHNGQVIYQRTDEMLRPIPSVDRVSFYQLRHILEGTVERGTAVAIKDLGGFVAGKTGTSNDYNDAWFVGFTNDLVVATWVGYDRKRSLGGGFAGGRVALPIAETIFRKSFNLYKAKEPLTAIPPLAPPAEIAQHVGFVPIKIPGNSNYLEIIRKFKNGRLIDPKSKGVSDPQIINYSSSDNSFVSDEQDARLFNDDQGIQDSIDRGEFILPDDGPRIPIGDEDMSDKWERDPRQVDPWFLDYSRKGDN